MAWSEILFVLGGGNALAAYQAGVLSALIDATIHPDRVSGASMGAVNAWLLAGNPPAARAAALDGFWREVSLPDPWSPGLIRGKAASALIRLTGHRLLFRPRLLPMQREGLYDQTPMPATLARHLDGQAPSVPLLVQATDLASGEPVWFDSRDTCLGPIHLLASSGLIPEFPPQRIDGRLLGDGVLSLPLPIPRLAPGMLVVAICCLPMVGADMDGFDAAAERRVDMQFGVCRALMPPLPEGARLLLLANPLHEGHADKQFDFSRTTIGDRWLAGRQQGETAARFLADHPTAADWPDPLVSFA